MKTHLLAFSLCAAAALCARAQSVTPAAPLSSLPAPTPWLVAERGASHKVWQRLVYEMSPDGHSVAKRHCYTELATGMHFKRNGQGDWLETSEQIALLPDGSAAATNGPHQVYFPADIYQGVIEQVTPDGLHLKSRPIGISYFDGTNNVLIAELTNSIGQILPSGNRIIYTNCLTDGVVADLVFTYRKSGFECDLMLRSRPPAPVEFGLDPARTRLQLLTEFIDTPEPASTALAVNPQDGLSDTTLRFGLTRMGRGKAFTVGPASGSGPGGLQPKPSGAGTARPTSGRSVPVYKTWQHLPDGRSILIEEVPYGRIKPQLDQLAALEPTGSRLLAINSARRRVSPSRMLSPARRSRASAGQVRLAQSDLARRAGVIIDYVDVNGEQDSWTFQGGTTYFVSGLFAPQAAIFQGGTVVKFPEGGFVNSNCSTEWQTTDYAPAVFTSENDDSAGEVLWWSSGAPARGWFTPLRPDGGSLGVVSNARFSYGFSGIDDEDMGDSPVLWNVQILNCMWGVTTWYGAQVSLHNVLFSGCDYALWEDSQNPCAIQGEHVTADQCASGFGNTAVEAYLTNCLFTGVAGSLPPPASGEPTVVWLASGAGIYQTAGGGNYYLADSSLYHNAGTTNIDPAVLADIATRTTYPPIAYTNVTFPAPAVFSPQAQRDNIGNPDLGYHYFPLDYIFGGCESAANLAFTAGASVGWFRTSSGWYHAGHGIHADDGTQITFNGTLQAPCYWVRLNTVQEQDQTGGCGPGGISGWAASPASEPQLSGSFTRFSTLAYEDGSHFRDDWGYFGANLAHCQFWNAGVCGYLMNLNFTNCEFNGTVVALQTGADWPSLNLRNCAFHGGQLYLSHWDWDYQWPTKVLDTVFDGASVITDDPTGGDTNVVYFDFNAYLTNCDRTYPTGAHDIIVTNFNWQTSWLGNYYLPTNSPLIDHGSVTADVVGLYHFTTQTNQLKETNSIVDIGYHYVAVDVNGNPISTSGDGIGDYLKDSNGNGIYDAGDLGNWTTNDTCGDGISDRVKWLEGRNLNVSALPDTTSLVNLRVYTPLK